MRLFFSLLSFLFFTSTVFSQTTTYWRGSVERVDKVQIPFTFRLVEQKGKQIIYVVNASEQIKVENIQCSKNSIHIVMPVFESSLNAKREKAKWSGTWVKGTSASNQVMPFEAQQNKPRFEVAQAKQAINISGRWAVNFASDKQTLPQSIAEFKQKGNIVTGTFLTPTGDYRFLEGVIAGNKINLSGFDGGHAMLFTADLINEKSITNGMFYSGAKYKEQWTAVKDANAEVKQDAAKMYVRPGEDHLNFHFPDLNKNVVSINDNRFKNKVVIVQLMGSWCPNCMDETIFLSDFYNKNKQKGIEIVSLAYEYSTDFERSAASLRKFQKRFNVQYPMLITGVTVSDTLRTEKTLSQVTPIKVFPSSIILDKQGKIRKLDTGFYGPGTGQHYEDYKKEFYATINELLKEK